MHENTNNGSVVSFFQFQFEHNQNYTMFVYKFRYMWEVYSNRLYLQSERRMSY